MSLAPPLLRTVLALAAFVQPLSPARAELVLSQLVVELDPAGGSREDIELLNADSERAYVVIEPAEIIGAGLPSESRKRERDPEKLGLLVSPVRAILEPGAHKIVRIAAIAPPSHQERVYRVTVKPVAGSVAAESSGLKLLVGYDVLVLVRPLRPTDNLIARRSGDALIIRNGGNASVELMSGKQCEAAGRQCRTLPGRRLYPGAEWSIPNAGEGQVEFAVRGARGVSRKTF